MKKTHIIALILIFTSIGVVIATLTDSSTYIDFQSAQLNPGKTFTVIGELDKEEQIHYDARRNLLTFFATDKNGTQSKVFYGDVKPTDFERSEDITMKGFATDSGFVATEILLKCPSKYNEQNTLAEVD
ncbi:MAG: cytochrome c maturation protein CcmE [Flavobacteriales bacterium]|nr:MAG: cytochrome c maturation protein CcmE [Flavobacteriales bacterium]